MTLILAISRFSGLPSPAHVVARDFRGTGPTSCLTRMPFASVESVRSQMHLDEVLTRYECLRRYPYVEKMIIRRRQTAHESVYIPKFLRLSIKSSNLFGMDIRGHLDLTCRRSSREQSKTEKLLTPDTTLRSLRVRHDEPRVRSQM